MANPEYWSAAEKALGISADEWIKFFTIHPDGATKSHTELARRAKSRLDLLAADYPEHAEKNLNWWAQGVSIAYEYEIGLRVKGQQCDGGFAASASKTLNGTLDQAYEQWQRFVSEELFEVDGVAWGGQPRLTASEKWRYWRCSLANGMAVEVNFSVKKPAANNDLQKVILGVGVTKLESSEQVEAVKTVWKKVLLDFSQWRESN